ncbi:MAG: recombinase family protein [Parafilimonas terrae]|nr:recombinase family protein [Parafilimonas terrae]
MRDDCAATLPEYPGLFEVLNAGHEVATSAEMGGPATPAGFHHDLIPPPDRHCVIYLRGTEEGKPERFASMLRQLLACEAFADGAGWPVRARFADADPGGKSEIIRAMVKLKPGDILLVESLTRFSTRIPYLNSVYGLVKGRGARIVPVDLSIGRLDLGLSRVTPRALTAEDWDSRAANWLLEKFG